MSNIRLLSVLVFFVFACSCNDSHTAGDASSKGVTAPKPTAPATSSLNPEGTQMLVAALSNYYALKNALVATKSADATTAAEKLIVTTDKLKTFLAHDSAHAALRPYVDTILNESVKVTLGKDETCEKQRLAFGTVSRAFYSLLKNADAKNLRTYHEFCPMAFNDKGATWLSDESEIKNPYFGQKMMECGEVTDSL